MFEGIFALKEFEASHILCGAFLLKLFRPGLCLFSLP
jgi:hypothetical protein